MEAEGSEMTGGCRGQQRWTKVVKPYTVQTFNQGKLGAFSDPEANFNQHWSCHH